MRSNKGITLVSLVASVLLVIILAATTIATSMNAYNQMKFEGAKAELEEMQKLVEEIASDYQIYKKRDDSITYVEYFTQRYNNDTFNTKLIATHETDTKISAIKGKINTASSETFYFTSDDLVKFFGLKGIEDVVADFSTRKVYSVDGIKDSNNKDTVYYAVSDWTGDKSIKSTASQTAITVTATKNSSKDVTLTFSTRLNTDVMEVYFAQDGTTNFVSADSFRDVTDTTGNTIIRATATISDTTKKYIFKLVDSAKNTYTTSTSITMN